MYRFVCLIFYETDFSTTSTPRSARMKNWAESRKIPTYVNGFSGHVTVKMNLFNYNIDAERLQTRLPSPECPVQ